MFRLYLVEIKILLTEHQFIKSSSDIMEVKCEFSYGDWSGNPTMRLYTCRVSEASIKEVNTTIRKFIGVHEGGKSDNDVEALIFNDTIVRYFPRGVSKIFPRLLALQISDCRLQSITRDDLHGLETLVSLSLFKNKLISLPENLLHNMRNLKRITLMHNDIDCLSSQMLKPLLNNGLTRAHFGKNKSIDAFYEPGCLGSVNSVDELMKIIDLKCKKPIADVEILVPSLNEPFKELLIQGIKDLWMSRRLSDFTIKVGSNEFRVHKFVLAIHSPKFASMLEEDNDENEVNEMAMKDVNLEAVEDFFRYLYTGEMSIHSDVLEIFAIAAKLGVTTLRNICEKKILDQLQESNAYKIFMLGHAFKSEVLKKAAFEKIRILLSDFKVSDEMIQNPESIKEMLDTKSKYDLMKTKFS